MSREVYPFGHSRELLARKKNLGLQFELIWRQNSISYVKLAPNEFKLEPEIFFSGQQLAAVTKGIQSPGHGAKKPSLTPSLVE